MHEERSNAESFHNTNNDEDGPYGCNRYCNLCSWNLFKEDCSNFEQCKNHQDDEVPEVNVLAHNQFVFAHNFTSIQIECWEDNDPSQIDKVPVETEVLDPLCIVFIPLSGFCLEDHVQHNQQSSEDVNTVRTGCHIED